MVSTEHRVLLERCLDGIASERESVDFETEVLVLDNASRDGSAGAARRHAAGAQVIALSQRRGKGENDSALLKRARGRFCLLLNEDSELLPGATDTLRRAMIEHPVAGAAGAALYDPDGIHQASAWRFPSPAVALIGALLAHRRFTVQSHGKRIRRVDWAQSAALIVRRAAAEQVGWFDPEFFVYSDEVDFCKRLLDAGWPTLYVPEARAVHHEQLVRGRVPERRIVEFARNRDLYMRKHHSAIAAWAVRWLTAWAYFLRTLAALAMPGHDARRYWRHVKATLRPQRGEGLREAAADLNRGPRL